MGGLSASQLTKIMPACSRPEEWVQPMNSAMSRFDITSNQRMAAFLAQAAHESGQLNMLTENLNYSAKRIMQVWPKRFPTLQKALLYERNPEKLANYVYAKRMGNGDEASGDGWRYRGRGIIQLSGRGNYRAAGEGTGLNMEGRPELLEKLEGAALAAAWFWKSRGLNELADDRNDDNDIEDFITITKRINGGTAGLKERIAFWERAKTVLSV